MHSVTIDAGDDASRWRWTCPVGHVGWQPAADGTIWCQSCDRHRDRDPYHDQLHDKRTGDAVPVAEVVYED